MVSQHWSRQTEGLKYAHVMLGIDTKRAYTLIGWRLLYFVIYHAEACAGRHAELTIELVLCVFIQMTRECQPHLLTLFHVKNDRSFFTLFCTLFYIILHHIFSHFLATFKTSSMQFIRVTQLLCWA